MACHIVMGTPQNVDSLKSDSYVSASSRKSQLQKGKEANDELAQYKENHHFGKSQKFLELESFIAVVLN